MTPRRWLFVASAVALLYAGQLLTAYIVAGTALPTQINSFILAVLAVAFTLAGWADLAARADRRLNARIGKDHDVVVDLLTKQATRTTLILERLEQINEVVAGLVALQASHSDEVNKRIAEIAGQVEALASSQARGNVSLHTRIDELADELNGPQADVVQVPRSTAARTPLPGRAGHRPGA